jgi:hypothetical protein
MNLDRYFSAMVLNRKINTGDETVEINFVPDISILANEPIKVDFI